MTQDSFDSWLEKELRQELNVEDQGFTEALMSRLPAPKKKRSFKEGLLWAFTAVFVLVFSSWMIQGANTDWIQWSGYYYPSLGLILSTLGLIGSLARA